MPREYEVLVRRAGGAEQLVRVVAETEQLAVRAAEHTSPEARAVMLIATMRVLGQCARCECVLFDADRPDLVRRAVNGHPELWRCRDC